MLRMISALGGTWMPRAFSTHRTEASAWTVVHTPQMRSQKAQASRGSRPCRMTSSAAPHGARRHGVLNLALPVEHGFDAEVAFNAGNGIDNHSC